MDHNHLTGSQQHALVMNTGSAPQTIQQRPTMIAQRASPTIGGAKAAYPLAQYTNLQAAQQSQASQPTGAQQQMMAPQAYHKQKQLSPDIGQFVVSTMGVSLPTQNGTYQSAPALSLHSGMGLEGSPQQLGLQQASHYTQGQQQQPTQYPPQQTRPQQYRQQPQQQQQQQVYPQAIPPQQNHHHPSHLQQQQQEQHVQQQFQIQQHLQQRSVNQQQRYSHKQQMQQPKQILQNNGEKLSVGTMPGSQTAANSSASSPSQLLSNTVLKSSEPITNGQLDAEEGNKENKFESTETTEQINTNTDSDTTSNASEKPGMANTKEKTPMCLINELARFNKMSHQYTLVDEQGPAHKKTFYVKLKLGDEEYSASGESIKKAQHAAADIALSETKFQHPPPKPVRPGADDLVKADSNITPTVELNALAMKRGETTSYKSIEPQQPPFYHQPHMDFRGLYNQRFHQYMRGGSRYHRGNGMMYPMRYHYPRMSRAFYVSLRVGHREFIGDGPTRQSARHNAAQKALRILKNLPIPNMEKQTEEEEEEEGLDDSLKSEISLVHEIALRRNMTVQFEVTRETGPPHMKNFVTLCKVAQLVTEGEGNSKKLSKKKAAELMLEELHKLPPTPSTAVCPVRAKAKNQINKKKNRNIIKSELQQQKADPNYGVGINPISRLIQIMQAQKKKEPVYTLVAERGLPRRREFIVQVEVEEQTSTGTGPNKKLAKRAAAEAMLQLLGYTKPSPQPTKSSIKNTSESGQSSGDRKVVHFVEGDSHSDDPPSSNCSQHQRVPGLLHLPTKTSVALAGSMASSSLSSSQLSSSSLPLTNSKEGSPSLVNLSNILKPSLRPEIQLRELCKALACPLEIDDFTKKRPSGTEHITRITVGGGDNPQRFHGSNTSLESSRDMAALDALKVLLARVKDSMHSAGDGPQMKKDFLIRSSSSTNPSKKDLPN